MRTRYILIFVLGIAALWLWQDTAFAIASDNRSILAGGTGLGGLFDDALFDIGEGLIQAANLVMFFMTIASFLMVSFGIEDEKKLMWQVMLGLGLAWNFGGALLDMGIGSDASIDISSVMTDMESRLMDMDLGPLFGLWFQSLFIGITMWALYICIFIVIYGRMIEIYLVTSVAPVPMAAMMGKDLEGLDQITVNSLDATKAPMEIRARGLGHTGTVKPFDLDIHQGEVVGVAGLLGSGRSELARVIYGADRKTSGSIKVQDKEADIKSPIDAMNRGMGMLPDDRKAEGIIGDLSIRENIILALQARRGMNRKLSREEQNEITDRYIDLLAIKCASRETPVKQLSGGNQQKVILARWLATDPDFLILDEPTRGIDIGTKTEIQKLISDLAKQGKSVLFISSEIEEMLRVSNRMVIMRDGEKVGELDKDLTQKHVMETIAGGEKE